MPARRLVALAALVALAPIACATQADVAQRRAQREAALARVPANAPAGVLAYGRWSGSMTGERPMAFSAVVPRVGVPATSTGLTGMGMPATLELTIEVYAWRDSARMAFAYPIGASIQGGSGRIFPRDVRVAGDTMTFELANALGWRDVACRVVVSRVGTWDGPCTTPESSRAIQLSLGVPRVASRQAPRQAPRQVPRQASPSRGACTTARPLVASRSACSNSATRVSGSVTR